MRDCHLMGKEGGGGRREGGEEREERKGGEIGRERTEKGMKEDEDKRTEGVDD